MLCKYPNLEDIIRQRDISISDLARAAGIAPRGMRDRLRGVRRMTLDEAQDILEQLVPDADLGWLFARNSIHHAPR